MQLKDIVVSPELCLKLWEAGIKSETIFLYVHEKLGDKWRIEKQTPFPLEGHYGLGQMGIPNDLAITVYPTYTTDELLPMCPHKLYGHIFENDLENADDVGYGMPYRVSCYDENSNKKKNPDILAELLLLINTIKSEEPEN